MCRRELFPAQPRPHHDLDDAGVVNLGQPGLRALEHMFNRLDPLLEISPAVRPLARLICRLSFPLDILHDSDPHDLAGMSVFAASHLLGYPITLDQIAQDPDCTPRGPFNTYRLFFPERDIVINSDFFRLLVQRSEHAQTSNLNPIGWPPPMYADAIGEWMTSHFETEHETILIEVSTGIFAILMVKRYFIEAEILHVMALSIYLASYLKQISVSCAEIRAATRVGLVRFRAIYARFYPHRKDLLEYPAFASVGYSFERLLADMPDGIDGRRRRITPSQGLSRLYI